MKFPVLCLLSLILCSSICQARAKAPESPKILFTSAPADNYEVYIMNPDGTEQVNLTQHRANDLRAVWSPTGEQILFVSDRDGVRDLYLMDTDGSDVRRVLKKEIYRDSPTWSPDGQQIAYTQMHWDQDKYPIYIATLEAQEEALGVDGLFPAWSPDGTEIAYVGFRFGGITFINVRTRKEKRFLSRKIMPSQLDPSWSAIGDKLAFSGNKHPLPPDRKPGDDLPPGWKDKQTIYIINRDGTGLQQLVDEAGPYAQYPALSPNGEEVLYTQEINDQFQIFKIDVNSGVRTQLTHIGWNFGGDWFDPGVCVASFTTTAAANHDMGRNEKEIITCEVRNMKTIHLSVFIILSLAVLNISVSPVFAQAPKTAKIAFWADRGGTRDIYLMNPDGTDQVKITQHRSQNITPVWSPTGEQILFVSDRDGVWDLYLMDPDGTDVRRVFEKEASRIGPTWSPDGKQIVYSRIIQDQRVVHVATLGEQDEERIAIGGSATWSPDGTELAFITGWVAKQMQITLLNLRTGNRKILFPPKAIPSWMSSRARWSPTGEKLAFSWLHRGPLKDFVETETVYTINRDGTGLTQIIEEAGPRATSPVWSPSGDALLYKRAAGNRSYQIFKISLDGGEPEQLTDIGWNHLGDWFDPAYALSVSPQPHLLTTIWGKMKKK